MKHATPVALDALEPLLAELRSLDGLIEKKRGIFYRRSTAFLHFHEDPTGLYADVRRDDGDFDRMKVDTHPEQDALLALAADRASRGR